MDRKAVPSSTRRKRRLSTFLWIAGLVAAVITLLYYQQVAVLYVLATLSVAGLLIIVALTDLGGARRVVNEVAPLDDAAAIADGAATSSATFSLNTPQTAKRR